MVQHSFVESNNFLISPVWPHASSLEFRLWLYRASLKNVSVEISHLHGRSVLICLQMLLVKNRSKHIQIKRIVAWIMPIIALLVLYLQIKDPLELSRTLRPSELLRRWLLLRISCERVQKGCIFYLDMLHFFKFSVPINGGIPWS